MTNLWAAAQRLKGDTLYTLHRHKPFDIVDVLSDRIFFVPQDGKGTPRWASREQIEHIYGLAKAGQDISQRFVQELYPNDYNTSYIVAIVKALVESPHPE